MPLTKSRPAWVLATVVVMFASVLALAPSAQAGDSTINVDTFDDELNDEDGDCSLREAIESANNATDVDGCESGSSGADIINVPAGLYELTRTNDSLPENANQTGDLDITQSVTIQATGGRATIDAGLDFGEGDITCDFFFSKYDNGLNDRVFHVIDSTVEMIGLNVQGGHVSSDGDDTSSSGGGGIGSDETSILTLTDVRVRRNAARAEGEGSESGGGGVLARGGLQVREDSIVEQNAVGVAEFGAGGGIAVENEFLVANGSEPALDGRPEPQGFGEQGVVRNSTVNNNVVCTDEGFGGGIATNSSLAVFRSVVEQNSIEGFEAAGGGIAGAPRNKSFPFLKIFRSDVLGNEARGFFRNAGGGVFNQSGEAFVEKSTIRGNDAFQGGLFSAGAGDVNPEGRSPGAVGGGIANIEAFMQVEDTTISNNTTTETQAVPLGEAPRPQGTNGEEPDTLGGGFFSDSGFFFFQNSTIARNEAHRGGGVFAFAFGGGKGPAAGGDLEHVTIARNEALDDGGGIDAVVDGGFVDVNSSIVGNNTPNDCGSSAISSDDWNVVSDNSCDFNEQHDLLNVNPRLNGLANNGGPTRTMLPEDNSPAVDHIGKSDPKTNNGCPPPDEDQRGVDRPKDGDGNGSKRCDAGAVELKTKKKDPFCEGFKGDPRNQIVGTNDKDTLVGTDGPDIICGKKGGDTIRGGDGNDILLGDDGNDNIKGGSGNDKVRANLGDDKVDGGTGDDTLHSGGADDTIFGGPGDDLIQGHTGDDHLDGESGNDRIEGHEHNDDLFGGSGNDVAQGGGQNDDIKGQSGDDKLKGLQGSDDLNGGADTDECDAGEGAGQTVVNCES